MRETKKLNFHVVGCVAEISKQHWSSQDSKGRVRMLKNSASLSSVAAAYAGMQQMQMQMAMHPPRAFAAGMEMQMVMHPPAGCTW